MKSSSGHVAEKTEFLVPSSAARGCSEHLFCTAQLDPHTNLVSKFHQDRSTNKDARSLTHKHTERQYDNKGLMTKPENQYK